MYKYTYIQNNISILVYHNTIHVFFRNLKMIVESNIFENLIDE